MRQVCKTSLSKSKVFNVLMFLCLLIQSAVNFCYSDPGYRTPGGRKAISYEPMTWYLTHLEQHQYLDTTATNQRYYFERMAVIANPGSNPPNIGLEQFLWALHEGNIGILRVYSHHSVRSTGGFFVEVYSSGGQQLREDALARYLGNP
jgi:hypothetical protein